MTQYGGVDSSSFGGQMRSATVKNGGSGIDGNGGVTNLAFQPTPDLLGNQQTNFKHQTGMNDKDSRTSFLGPPVGNGLENRKSSGEGYDVIETRTDDCGLGCCHPHWLQKFKTVGWFSALYGLSGIATSALSSYIGSQITTLEKHFNFNSSVSGMLMSCNDFGYFLTCLFLSYFTRRIHIPRCLSMAVVLYGLSGLICIIPYFGTRDVLMAVAMAGNSSNVSKSASPGQMCIRDTNSSTCHGALRTSGSGGIHGISDHWRTLAIALIGTGMVVQGVAKSPRQSFVSVYIDDNVPKTRTTFYLGIITGMAIFGPSLAFIMGGLFSGLYITLEDTNLTSQDPRWLGAWWLGFLLFGLVSLVVGLPLLFFPKKIILKPEVEMLERERKMKSHDQNKVIYELKEFFTALWKLLRNPLYILLVLATGFRALSIGGMMSFQPKYLEEHFNIPASTVNIVLGALSVGGASIGTIAGGVVTSKYRISPKSCLKLHICVVMLSLAVSVSTFFIKCAQPDIHFGDTNLSSNASSPCSKSCACNDIAYFPVCGDDGLNYFSPCHAGCTDTVDNGKIFSNCSCLSTPDTVRATGGLCESDCRMEFWLYTSLSFFSSLGMTFTIMPAFVATVRSVSEDQKPMALGISAFIATLIGWFPGPIIFGKIVDTTCLLTQSSPCGEEADKNGACLLYDLAAFRNRYHGAIVGLRCVALVLSCCAFAYVLCSPSNPFSDHDDQSINKEPNDTTSMSMTEKPIKSMEKSGTFDRD